MIPQDGPGLPIAQTYLTTTSGVRPGGFRLRRNCMLGVVLIVDEEDSVDHCVHCDV